MTGTQDDPAPSAVAGGGDNYRAVRHADDHVHVVVTLAR
jgi:hypothetical protein